ncbi:MAG: ABC transporter C-terminal domain-containing protein, partial [bacterium]
TTAAPRAKAAAARAGVAQAKRLSWAEQREWDGIEAAILAAEQRLEHVQTAAHDPSIAARADEVASRWRDVTAAQTEVERLFARWTELEAKRGG